MDRLYASISTANWLLKNEITVVATLVTNCIDFPHDLKKVKQRGEFENTMHWETTEGDLSLCMHTTKSKSKGKKNVLVLSTMRPLMGITRNDGKQKPAIIKFYDFTKEETDVMDQKISKYSCKLLTHSRTIIHFFSSWIPSAATPWYFMRSSIRNRFANPILLIMFVCLSLLC